MHERSDEEVNRVSWLLSGSRMKQAAGCTTCFNGTQSGGIAAILARKGSRGPARIIEAEDGDFTSRIGGLQCFQDPRRTGQEVRYEDVAIKPYPACASLHSSVDAALTLRTENEIAIVQIKEIRVHDPGFCEIGTFNVNSCSGI